MIIILIAIAAHLILFLLLKPRYLEIFKTDIDGDEGMSAFHSTDHPLSLVPYPEPPPEETPPSPVPTSEKVVEIESFMDEWGEPAMEIEPFPGRSGGGDAGRPGPRLITVEPKPLFMPWPKYPEGADRDAEGRVELLLFVNEKGEVEDIKLARGLPQEILNNAAIKAAWDIRFVPGKVKGVPTSMWVRLTIGFQSK
ncbi:MAG: TonB family protein [Candidatus Krumholzibacteriota bacterium]|nr:TonB family protein [Candidatus Krumholzibacteriota bacterium]